MAEELFKMKGPNHFISHCMRTKGGRGSKESGEVLT
jgi:hypothetical protein